MVDKVKESIQELTVVGTLIRENRRHTVPATLGAAGATAGWVVAGANLAAATCPASQTASTLVIPIPGLRPGDTILSFNLLGQVESAGNAVTVDAALRKLVPAAADNTDSSVGAITQVSVTADTALTETNSAKTGLSEVVGEDEVFYVLVTATTGASTDIALLGVSVEIDEA